MFLKRFPYLRKRAEILRGYYRANIRGNQQGYDTTTWWDEHFFTQGVSDRQTLSSTKSALTAAYHYASVELLILRDLQMSAKRIQIKSASVCDLGTGSGHWIDFYLSIGASRCVGIDVSEKATSFLREKYSSDERVAVLHGRLNDVLRASDDSFEIVNAIGVMFHVVDDEEWEATIREVGQIIHPGGLFIVGGHFGWLDHVNVYYQENAVCKRLRSASHWRRSLRDAGFGEIRILRNPAYRYINAWIPENNVLVATKL